MYWNQALQVIRKLSTQPHQVRQACKLLVPRMRDPTVRRALVDRFIDETDPIILDDLGTYLISMVAWTEVGVALSRLLGTGVVHRANPDQNYLADLKRRSVVRVLAPIAGVPGSPVALRMADTVRMDPDALTRAAAVEVLAPAMLLSQDAAEAVRAASADPDPQVRTAAAWALLCWVRHPDMCWTREVLGSMTDRAGILRGAVRRRMRDSLKELPPLP